MHASCAEGVSEEEWALHGILKLWMRVCGDTDEPCVFNDSIERRLTAYLSLSSRKRDLVSYCTGIIVNTLH
jgi:hypothetical protein